MWIKSIALTTELIPHIKNNFWNSTYSLPTQAEVYCQYAPPFLQSEANSISNPYIVTWLTIERAANKSLQLLWHILHRSQCRYPFVLFQFELCDIKNQRQTLKWNERKNPITCLTSSIWERRSNMEHSLTLEP